MSEDANTTPPPSAPFQRIEIPPRESLRHGEIETHIRRPVAKAMAVLFLLVAFGVPCVQAIIEASRGQTPRVLNLFRQQPTRENLHAYERSLETASMPRDAVAPFAQTVLTAQGGFGNKDVIVGRDGWLFYRAGVEFVMGRGFLDADFHAARRRHAVNHHLTPPNADPRGAIVAFDQVCKQFGAKLIVVPVPDKAMLQPAQLAWNLKFESPITTPENPDYMRFIIELKEAGVDVFDPSPTFLTPGDEPRFLIQDTHWTPQWMQSVAEQLAKHIQVSGIDLGRTGLKQTTRLQTVSRTGDLADMLKTSRPTMTSQSGNIQQVLDESGNPWRPRKSAEVLLLGDSFTNIYSAAPMGWGESAGFAEHLSLQLGRPIDRLSRNDNGAYATRQMLADELAKGNNRLAGKKIVIWQFAVRELSSGDWKPIHMKLGKARPAKFFVPVSKTTPTITGVIESISLVPRPGTVPYKDHILALHLVDIEGDAAAAGGQAHVYMWSMRDNVQTPAAAYRPGDRVTLKVESWDDLAESLETINRSELEDDTARFEPPVWGEPIP